MKIGVSAYCYSRLIKRGEMSLFDAIEDAKDAGFQVIEFSGLEAPPGKDLAAYAVEIKAACDAAGLAVANYASAADFLNGSGGDIGAETRRVKEAVDIAKILGAPCMRHDAAWGIKETAPRGCRTWRDAVAIIAPAIREVAEYAASRGIRTMTENHGQFLQESARVEALVLAVNHSNYGLLVDIGNFLCADEPGIEALPVVMPYAFHVHAKDFLWKSAAQGRPDDSWFPTRNGSFLRGTILGHGVIEAAQCLDFIKKSGYQGTVSLEFEGVEEVPVAVRKGCAFLKAHLG